MDKAVDDRIQKLAQPLWDSAARPYGVALDFWLMAEQMVLEAVTMTARLHNKAVSPPPPSASPSLGEVPVEAPVARVRELAECMWASAGRQYGMAQDFWLSAERHVLAMLRASTAPAAAAPEPWTAELKSLSPSAYLERIRVMAYYYWEAAGRGYGEALEYWLKAERDLLGAMAAATERGTPLGASAVLSPVGGVPTDIPTPVAAATTSPNAPPETTSPPSPAISVSPSADALEPDPATARRPAAKGKRATRASAHKPAGTPTKH